MAIVKTVTITFSGSDSPDVIDYKLYVEEAPTVVSYQSSAVSLGNVTSVDLSTIKELTTKDGIYNIGITALDTAGNESSMSLLNDVPLDFAAPNPPGQLVIVRS